MVHPICMECDERAVAKNNGGDGTQESPWQWQCPACEHEWCTFEGPPLLAFEPGPLAMQPKGGPDPLANQVDVFLAALESINHPYMARFHRGMKITAGVHSNAWSFLNDASPPGCWFGTQGGEWGFWRYQRRANDGAAREQ